MLVKMVRTDKGDYTGNNVTVLMFNAGENGHQGHH